MDRILSIVDEIRSFGVGIKKDYSTSVPIKAQQELTLDENGSCRLTFRPFEIIIILLKR
jgi:hypothetical protein